MRITVCSINSPRTLEFPNALAPPALAFTIALLAIPNLRAQTLIERHLDWCQKTHRALGKAGARSTWKPPGLLADRRPHARQSEFDAIQ